MTNVEGECWKENVAPFGNFNVKTKQNCVLTTDFKTPYPHNIGVVLRFRQKVVLSALPHFTTFSSHNSKAAT